MNPAYHTVPNPTYLSSPKPAFHSPDPTSQVPPREENMRPSVHVTQHSSPSSLKSFYKRARREVTEVDLLKPQTRSPRSKWSWHILSHLISFLWLGPIVLLLVLNYKRQIIGASVWCPLGKCSADVLVGDNNEYIQRANKLDRADHNALGALQFAAKGLEIWFMLVATALVYDVAMLFARRGGGLPLGYLLTHLEFGDFRNLFKRSMWTSPIPHANSLGTGNHSRTFTLYLFALLVTCLTILTNLMGPATAVLIMPTLQWIDAPHKADQIFKGIGAADLPGGDPNSFPQCNNDALTQRAYSCNMAAFGPSLDAWATSAAANVSQSRHINRGVSQAGAFDFMLNASTTDPIIWVPNRQVLKWLSDDMQRLFVEDVIEDPMYNNSLATVLQRSGPSIGLHMYCSSGNWTIYTINEDKTVRCFSGWTIDYESYYTKCIRSGSAATQWTNFSLENTIPGQENITVLSAFSEKSVFFNDTDDFGSGIKSCFDSKELTDCDWDKIFDHEPPQNLRNRSVNVGVTVYAPQGKGNGLIWCDQIAYLGFPTYQIDLSRNSFSELLGLVQLHNISYTPLDHAPLVVNPSWLLAAWSVDMGGTADGSRPIVKDFARILPSVLAAPTPWTNDTKELMEFEILHMYASAQAMSMVNYYWDNATANSSVHADADHPYLYHFSTLHVWAFGFSGRTSRIGVAVVLVGSLCVLVRLALGFGMLRHDHSAVELFVAALEHQHQQEFGGLHHENDWAKVRYRIKVGDLGKPTFQPDRTNWGSPPMP